MLISIQHMRAMAAILVVIHHAAWKGTQYSTNPLDGFIVGNIGVDLFFIISGYIMCFTSDKKRIRFSEFITARVIRIIPLYWILTSVALAIYFILPEKVNSSGGETNIFASYFLYPISGKYLIQNGWSLSYEFYFYFIFAIGASLAFLGKYTITVMILSVFVALGFFVSFDSTTYNFLTNQLLAEFIMGMLAFLVLKKYSIPRKVSFILLIASVTWIIYLNIGKGFGIRILDYGVACWLFFVAYLSLEKDLIRMNTSQLSLFFQALGNSSYSLYLFHPFVLTLMSIIMVKLGLEQYGYVFITILVTCSVIGGHLCFLLLEKPLTAFLKVRVNRF